MPSEHTTAFPPPKASGVHPYVPDRSLPQKGLLMRGRAEEHAPLRKLQQAGEPRHDMRSIPVDVREIVPYV